MSSTPKIGSPFTARVVSNHPECGQAVAVEVWSRAPLSKAGYGYCDPWWVLVGDARVWYILARTSVRRGQTATWHVFTDPAGTVSAIRDAQLQAA